MRLCTRFVKESYPLKFLHKRLRWLLVNLAELRGIKPRLRFKSCSMLFSIWFLWEKICPAVWSNHFFFPLTKEKRQLNKSTFSWYNSLFYTLRWRRSTLGLTGPFHSIVTQISVYFYPVVADFHVGPNKECLIFFFVSLRFVSFRFVSFRKVE